MSRQDCVAQQNGFQPPTDHADPEPLVAAAARRLKCHVVDDETAIRDMMFAALNGIDLDFKGFATAATAIQTAIEDRADLVFLDLALDGSDAVCVIRGLGERQFRGAIQQMSGRDQALLDQVKRIGEQHGLSMLPPLLKPFRRSQVRAIVERCRADLFDRPAETGSP